MTNEPLSAARRAQVARIPLVRAQVRGLRTAALLAQEEIEKTASEPDKAGLALTSNMLMGFALELGLKLFFMMYVEGVPRGHELHKLYEGLPDQIKDDIAETYSGISSPAPTLTRYAFRLSPDAPQPPTENGPRPYGSAQGLFKSASDLFVQARYFYENLSYEAWAIIDQPIQQMARMSEVLDVVFDEYIRRGSWAGDWVSKPASSSIEPT